MIALEDNELDGHEKNYNNTYSNTPILSFIGLLAALVAFAFAYLRISRDLGMVKEANAMLVIAGESTSHAEKIGGYGTTLWRIDKNEMIFSDNLYRLLGWEPQAFVANAENFTRFVHPEDKHLAIHAVQRVEKNKVSLLVSYRIIRPDGEIRYLSAIGKIFTQNNIATHISVVKDVTDDRLLALALAERNEALERSNHELASFNHIASHDLQEPLRKIQTFVSRILDKDAERLSEFGKNYFVKIENAAHRMRLLINDLLLFSQTTKVEKMFILSDLNVLLDHARQEFAEHIAQQSAVIEVTPLPKLRVIPFQIQQLFINLIGNALRYSSPERTPLVQLRCIVVPTPKEPFLIGKPDKKYYKITITDNGIGFDPQYAETIFELFQRLDTAAEQRGTGIGLAICKKIVQNHNGFIFAEGRPHEGATFTVYLPTA